MNIRDISINGYRGFGTEGIMQLGVPNGKLGSGLTIIVGPNNAGKSTIIEAFHILSKNNPPSLAEGKRNKFAGEFVSIQVTNINGEKRGIQSDFGGTSETKAVNKDIRPLPSEIFVLLSRRTFSPFFGSTPGWDRAQYITNTGLPSNRGEFNNYFTDRFFKIQKNKDKFNEVFVKVLSPMPEWKIELSDTGSYYIKFGNGNLTHNSDGLGEGLISLFFMIDSLYDSKEGEIIVIDEPELSLHPSFQRRLIQLFAEYAKNRQIVIATHSPYFIDWSSIKNGAKIARVVKENDTTKIYQLSSEISEKIKNMGKDLNNPHVFGLDANEVFFLEDNIILVEGQEDVIFYNKIMNELGIEINGDSYGWGVSGSNKMNIIASILRKLGFKRVVGVLDKDKESEKDELIEEFSEYNFFCIPSNDVRTKEARKAKEQVIGLVDEKGKIRMQYKEEIKDLFGQINSKLSTS